MLNGAWKSQISVFVARIKVALEDRRLRKIIIKRLHSSRGFIQWARVDGPYLPSKK